MSTIVICDDNIDMTATLDSLLSDVGYTCYCCHSGDEVLKLIDRVAVDLIITDIHMPDMDGLALLSHIRTSNKEMPILFITADLDFMGRVTTDKDTHNIYLIKPIRSNDMLATIDLILNKKIPFL
jgi:DNA-binding response OmpR family regulator